MNRAKRNPLGCGGSGEGAQDTTSSLYSNAPVRLPLCEIVVGDGGLIETARTSWGADDRKWFVQHPDRTHRVREVFTGEFPEEAPDGFVGHVVVRQWQPGLRQSLGFAWSQWLNEPSEAWCHALFDTLDECRTNPKGEAAFIDDAGISERAGFYVPSGVVQ